MSTKFFETSKKYSLTISAIKKMVNNINNKTLTLNTSLILHYSLSLTRRIQLLG